MAFVLLVLLLLLLSPSLVALEKYEEPWKCVICQVFESDSPVQKRAGPKLARFWFTVQRLNFFPVKIRPLLPKQRRAEISSKLSACDKWISVLCLGISARETLATSQREVAEIDSILCARISRVSRRGERLERRNNRLDSRAAVVVHAPGAVRALVRRLSRVVARGSRNVAHAISRHASQLLATTSGQPLINTKQERREIERHGLMVRAPNNWFIFMTF